MKKYITTTFGFDCGLPEVDLLELIPEFQEIIYPYSFLEGQALPTDLGLLKGLARQINECSYLEIGSWRGESIANVASVARECVSISLSADEMREAGFSEEFISTHGHYSKGIPNIKFIGHNSHTFDYADYKNHFDLIFIDGDHARESVKIDTQNAFTLLKNEHSIIVWHDYGFTPETVHWTVLAGILDGCPEGKRGNLYHVSNTLCAIFINKSFPKKFRQFPRIPDKTFEVRLSAQRT